MSKKNSCGGRARELREEAGITQTELAGLMQLYGIDIDQKAISRLELQERLVSDFELWALSQVLNVEMSDLMKDLPVVELPEQLREKWKSRKKKKQSDTAG